MYFIWSSTVAISVLEVTIFLFLLTFFLPVFSSLFLLPAEKKVKIVDNFFFDAQKLFVIIGMLFPPFPGNKQYFFLDKQKNTMVRPKENSFGAGKTMQLAYMCLFVSSGK